MYSLSPSVLSPAQPGGREGGREEGGGGMEGAGKERGSEEKRLHISVSYISPPTKCPGSDSKLLIS